jgi:transcriptional regulator with XRE-family HTH domain
MRSLRSWRIERLWSVRDLAKRAGISTKTVIQLEHGRQRPTFRTMRRVCAALGVEPHEVSEFAAALRDRSTGGPPR